MQNGVDELPLVARPRRLSNWPQRLHAVLEWHRRHDFAWGRFDCGTLFSDVCSALTGVDPAAGHVWRDEREAMKFLARHRVQSMAEFVAQRFEPVPVAHARRGDVGFVAERIPLTCPAIIVGAEAVSRDQAGWTILPREILVAAYRVG